MGVSIWCWALPPASVLFARLQNEKPMATLMTELFPCGNGIFHFFEEIDPREREEILDEVTSRCLEVFGSKSDAKHWIEKYRHELQRTRLAYPGIENRDWSLENSFDLIEERLLAELLRLHVEDAAQLVSKLIFGERELYSDSYRGETGLSMISAPLVRQGSQILNGLDIEALFPEARGVPVDDILSLQSPPWQMRDFLHWRGLFREAAEAEDVLVVGVC